MFETKSPSPLGEVVQSCNKSEVFAVNGQSIHIHGFPECVHWYKLGTNGAFFCPAARLHTAGLHVCK